MRPPTGVVTVTTNISPCLYSDSELAKLTQSNRDRPARRAQLRRRCLLSSLRAAALPSAARYLQPWVVVLCDCTGLPSRKPERLGESGEPGRVPRHGTGQNLGPESQNERILCEMQMATGAAHAVPCPRPCLRGPVCVGTARSAGKQASCSAVGLRASLPLRSSDARSSPAC